MCKDDRCGPHGVCLINPQDNSPECKCIAGYTGSYCQQGNSIQRCLIDKTSLTPSLFIEVPVPRRKVSGHVFVCLRVSILLLVF